MKVFAGDISGLSAEWFRQEIQLLARLQHRRCVAWRQLPSGPIFVAPETIRRFPCIGAPSLEAGRV